MLTGYGKQPTCHLCGGTKAPIVNGEHLDKRWCDDGRQQLAASTPSAAPAIQERMESGRPFCIAVNGTPMILVTP